MVYKVQTVGVGSYSNVLIQVALIPFKNLKITQGPGIDSNGRVIDTYSHDGYRAIDDGGKYSAGSYKEPAYAPFDMKCVWNRVVPGGNTYLTLYESLRPVLCADGSEDYVSMLFTHGGNLDYISEGKVLLQGAKCYQEGNDGTANEHIHFNVKKGKLDHSSLLNCIEFIPQNDILDQSGKLVKVVALKDDCQVSDVFWLYKDDVHTIDQKGLNFKTYTGSVQLGWYKSSTYKVWYYANETDGIVRNWKQINGIWYYFNPDNCIMQTNTWVNGASGGVKYYVKANGAMAKSEFIMMNGKTYNFDVNGVCLNP